MEGVPGRDLSRAKPTRGGTVLWRDGKGPEPDARRAMGRDRGNEENPCVRTAARQGMPEVRDRAVGLSQPKGAGSLWSTREKRTFFSRTTPHDGAEAATVKSRGTER
jgi:hypothetical protein